MSEERIHEIINAVSCALISGIKTHPCPNKRVFHGKWNEIVLPAGKDSSFYISIPGEACEYLKNEAHAKIDEITKDQTIKNIEELLRQKDSLIENMKKEWKDRKNFLDLKVKQLEMQIYERDLDDGRI